MAVGRNEPCPCGSGEKYKKCCLRRDKEVTRTTKIEAARLMLGPHAPYIACPACGENEFGVLMISGDGYTRRCRKCKHTTTYGLPVLQKTVVYLDQFVISNITKLLDPEFPRRDRLDPYWLELYKKLDRLLRLQLVVCPASHFHRTESLLSGEPPFELLEHVYAYLSNDCTFYDDSRILQSQVLRHFKLYIDGRADQEPFIATSGVVAGDLNEWMARLWVRVPEFADDEAASSFRAQRVRQHAALAEVFRRWQEDRGTFAASLQEEAQAFGRALVEVFIQQSQKWGASRICVGSS
jgi:SEC-C motif